jgi:acyl-CoA-dependent ceramide synthase
LNYLDHFLVGPYFALFVCVWIYTRHYLNIVLLISEFNEFKTVGPYGMDWYGESFKGPLSHYLSTVLISGLQALNLFWLFHILRIAWRFIAYTDLADDRSDEEDEEVDLIEAAEIDERNTEEKLKLMGVGLKPEDYLVEGGENKDAPAIMINGAPPTITSAVGNATGVETLTKTPKSRKQRS